MGLTLFLQSELIIKKRLMFLVSSFVSVENVCGTEFARNMNSNRFDYS